MQTTSSRISEPGSSAFSAVPFVGWSALATAFVAAGFFSRSDDSSETSRALYDYSFAAGTVLVYAVLVGITFLIALAYKGWSTEAIGLRTFSLRWAGIAVGLIVLVLILASALEPVLHGGRDQGLSPKAWEPDHAGAFALNGLVVATVVPFTEELFFRGLGVRALGFLGGIVAVVLTGLVFGLSHGILGALPPLVLFGVALGWVRLRADSVWPGVIAHGVYNGIGILVIYLQLAY